MHKALSIHEKTENEMLRIIIDKIDIDKIKSMNSLTRFVQSKAFAIELTKCNDSR